MDTPTCDNSSPEIDMSRDSASPSSRTSHTPKQGPTPISGSSSRVESPKNAPVDEFRAFSKPIGPSQRDVKNKRKAPPTRSEWIGKVTITFTQPEERLRAQGKMLPESIYRTFYEGSATLSAFVTPDCLAKHRDFPHLKLEGCNAFQNIGDFDPLEDMTPERMRRQHKPTMKRNPSPFVSAFGRVEDAENKAVAQYTHCRLVGHRVSIAEISMAGMIPATIRGSMRTHKCEYVKNSLVAVDRSSTVRSVRCPVRIRDTARPADGSPITFQQLHESGADMWTLGVEMGKTGHYDMNYGAADTHDDEWLCCGPVPLSCITRVMPFDGETLHHEMSHKIVKSTQSIEIYIFDWEERKWRHNPKTNNFRAFREAIRGVKRKRTCNKDHGRGGTDNSDSDEDPEPRQKRAQVPH